MNGIAADIDIDDLMSEFKELDIKEEDTISDFREMFSSIENIAPKVDMFDEIVKRSVEFPVV